MKQIKEQENRVTNFYRIEFWAAITLFAFLLAAFLSESLATGLSGAVLIKNIIVFSGFMALNFIIVPSIIRKHRVWINLLFILLTIVVVFVVLGVCDTYIKLYLYKKWSTIDETHDYIFDVALIDTIKFTLLFAVYTALRYSGLYIIKNAERISERYRFFAPGGLIAFVIYLILLFVLAVGGTDEGILFVLAVSIPSGILLYWFSFHRLIPKSLKKQYGFTRYAVNVSLVLFAAYLPVAFLTLIFIEKEDLAFSVSFLNSMIQFFITMPLCWVLYKRSIRGNEELYALKTELGQTSANLDFLRSQINPHFLFNALNTIYGTAIQEKAERTSEGIERLGDMMRFMLQENMQDKIPLAREIEYLNNYIALQRLRTDPNPGINIQAVIQDRGNIFQIAPMLLIPFVENAFKHGISFREPSQIKVTLEIKDNTIYFDVYNIKHPGQDNDPEKDKSGIGLENVKQRLRLLYPNKHELIIRDTTKEFFIHLTLQLK